MTQSRLLIGLVSVFAGMTVLFLVLSFVFSPAMLVAAALFGATTYLLWFHASGKLQEQVHRQANAARRPRARSAVASVPARASSGRDRDRVEDRGRKPAGAWDGRRRATNSRSQTPTVCSASNPVQTKQA
ncbi:hypothetical protein ACFQH3_03255 [Haladaptatus sp. GCM10025707]|uniref:hypothetical protein n=1 Tax=unclassified Haladaptatus TaxID=2622732 RepID=UPI00361B198A